MDHSPFDFILVENSSRQSLACLELESIGSLECKLKATTTLLDQCNHQHLHTIKEWNWRQKPGERQDNSTSGGLQVLPLRKSQGQPSMSNSWTNCRKEPDMGRGPLQEAAWQYFPHCQWTRYPVEFLAEFKWAVMSSTFRIFNLWIQFFQTSLRESTHDIQHQQPPFLSATSHRDPFHTELTPTIQHQNIRNMHMKQSAHSSLFAHQMMWLVADGGNLRPKRQPKQQPGSGHLPPLPHT